MDITLDNITFAYKSRNNVLSDVSASFKPGIHLLLGPNGAGKTTLLKVMAGLLVPQRGHCIIDREDVDLHAPVLMRQIFMLPDDCIFPLDTVNMMARRHGEAFYPTFSPEVLKALLEAFSMSGDENLSDLSLGNRKKANIAYALALGTPILMLDEPGNGLDIASKKTLTSMLAEAATPSRSIFIATHSIHDLEPLFDTVTIIRDGRIILSAAIEEISTRLAFVTEPTPRNDALWSENAFDGCHQIVPAENAGRETKADLILLYDALTADNANPEMIVKLFKNDFK